MSDTRSHSPRNPAGARHRNVEEILPLLPNQKALLLYRELEMGEDPGFLQVRFGLHGPLDLERFKHAWDAAIRWHPALRMSIHSRAGGDPLAVAWHDVELPWSEEDWSGMEEDEQERRMAVLLDSDRVQGLDLAHAPAMRVTVAKLSDRRHEVVWTCHHLFSDGWSAAIVLEDVMSHYRALAPAGVPPPAQPPADGLRAYVSWATKHTKGSVQEYWSKRLRGFEGLPPLYLGAGSLEGAGRGEHSIALDAAVVEKVSEISAELQVTVYAFIQAAWSLVLSRLFDEDDVVFGTTVAGRSAPVEGMERLVGYFSNAVPVRATIDDSQTVSEWLRMLGRERFDMQAYEHASLAEVHGWSEVPGHRALFETFLVFENLPNQPAADDGPDGLTMTGFRSGLTAAFPLTIAVTLGEPWVIHGRFDRTRCREDAVRLVVGELAATLEALAAKAGRNVGELVATGFDHLSSLLTGPSQDTTAGTSLAGYRAPTTNVEHRLASIWMEVLDLPQVGIDDDYFALGGTSIGAVKLFGQIEEEFGVALPIHTLVQHATVAGLARVLAGDEGSSVAAQSLVTFQTEGDKPPVACVHDGGGNVLFYRELAKRLGTDQPVYGFEPLGLDGHEAPLEHVPEMAARYIEELRTVHPEGPYRLVGYCFGGAVGLEMAHQLEAMGEQVDLLAIIDAGLPLEAARAATTRARAAAVLRTRGPFGAIQALLRRIRHRGGLWWDGSFAGAEGRIRANRGQAALACNRAFSRWQPKASSAPITFIRSTRYRAAVERDFHYGWDAYSPQVDSIDIDTDHFSLFKAPAVEELALAIRSRLSAGD